MNTQWVRCNELQGTLVPLWYKKQINGIDRNRINHAGKVWMVNTKNRFFPVPCLNCLYDGWDTVYGNGKGKCFNCMQDEDIYKHPSLQEKINGK